MRTGFYALTGIGTTLIKKSELILKNEDKKLAEKSGKLSNEQE